MNDQREDRDPPSQAKPAESNAISPLPGEAGIPDIAAPKRISMSKKGLLGAVLFIVLLVAVVAFFIQKFATSKKTDDEASKLVRDKPAAASTEPRKLDLPAPTAQASAPATSPRIPAVVPTAEEVQPIGVRRTGSTPSSGAAKPITPEDAPVMVVSTRPGVPPGAAVSRTGAASSDEPVQPGQADAADAIASTSRNLQGYQRQLHGMLDNLTRAASLATAQATGQAPSATVALPTMAPPGTAPAGLFGGQLQGSGTPKVAASTLGNRSLTLPKGTAFTCALKTRVISATSGLVGCQVQRNVYGDDGRVLLIERGSHLDGEYRIASVKPGTVRIPVVWTRVRTPLGVTVDIDSPGTGQLGDSGIDGYVDNRWMERIGAAMLLSLIDDSVKLVIQNQANDRQGDTIVLPSTTANTSKLAEKVLDSTINIPPLIYQNQGGIVGIYVARDVDFSSVYELKPVER